MNENKSSVLTNLISPAIYISSFPFELESTDVFPISRKEQIDSCQNKEIKAQKFFAWKLLEYALKENGLDIKDFSFECVSGHWQCKDFCFSISHSDSIVVVAIDNIPIGVDIEKKERMPKHSNFTDKISHPNETKNNDMEFSRLWTRKESAFKKNNLAKFTPSSIDTTAGNYVEFTVSFKGNNYSLCVAIENKKDLKVVSIQEDLSITKRNTC